jgi:hypothetical protein
LAALGYCLKSSGSPLTAISVERIVVTKKVQNLLVAGQDIQNIRWATEVIALVPSLSFDRAL